MRIKEELILVKGIDEELYSRLKGLITVYGSGKVNINTASEEVLAILINACVKRLEARNIEERDPSNLSEEILSLRKAGINFSSPQDLEDNLTDALQDPGARNVMNELYSLNDFESTCFSILSNGTIDKKTLAEIECVYERAQKKIVVWNEI